METGAGKELEFDVHAPEEARADLRQGVAVRAGVNDMKGTCGWHGPDGLVWAPDGTSGTAGLSLFAAVDEEAYSCRNANPSRFYGMVEQFGLEYGCLVDLEPNFNEDGRQQVYIGSVGRPCLRCWSGVKAHVVDCFPRIERQ